MRIDEKNSSIGLCAGMLRNAHGWMACDFMSFPRIFQSYQSNGRFIVKVWFAMKASREFCRGMRRTDQRLY